MSTNPLEQTLITGFCLPLCTIRTYALIFKVDLLLKQKGINS